MKKFFCFVAVILFSFSCKKDDENDIPNVLVDFTISVSSYPSLNAVTGWAYVGGGVKGIVIYHYSQGEFYAIERNCSYQPANGTQVSVDNSGLILVDGACGSKFNMTDGGSVHNGPATRPLKRYNATFDGVNAIHIYN